MLSALFLGLFFLRASASKCLLSGNPSAPHRRPPSSAVSALVLSLTAPLLRAYLRVSVPPRQNHTLGLPSPFHHDPFRGMELCASPPETRPLRTGGHHPPSRLRVKITVSGFPSPSTTGACFGGAGFSLPIRAKLGLFFLRASASKCLLTGRPHPPLSTRSSSLSLRRFSALISASPRLRVKITISG